MFTVLLALFSCKNDPEPEPAVLLPSKKYEYLKLLPETAHNITVTKLSNDYHYLLATTEHDPYVSTGQLAKANPADSTVLCFEYKSDRELEFVQIFLQNPSRNSAP
jgi:hypothetical protein